MSTVLTHTIRSTLWLAFFAAILAAWWVMYVMALDMDLDLLGSARRGG